MSQEKDQQLQEEAKRLATGSLRREDLGTASPELRALIAGNPATPAEMLEDLAYDKEAQVRAKVAGNPNVPWRWLEYLAWEFPQAFLSNPAALLQMMAYPEQITTDDKFWEHLLHTTAVPDLWWNWLRSRPASSVSPSVRLHIRYRGESTHPFGTCEQEDIHDLLTLLELLLITFRQGSIFADPACPPFAQQPVAILVFIKEELQRLASHPEEKVKQAVAQNEQTPVEILQILAQDQASNVRRYVASHPQTPVEILLKLAQDEDQYVREQVASHPQTPAEALQMLAQTQDQGWIGSTTRRHVAAHPQVTEQILRMLAQDEEKRVREEVAGNPLTPAEVLRSLALNKDRGVLRVVARNSQTPIEALQRLAKIKKPSIKAGVAIHPYISEELLCLLAQDESADVRKAVASRSELRAETLRALSCDRYEPVRRTVAGNDQVPVEILQTLARDKKISVRRAVARNKKTPVEILQTLAKDKEASVRIVIASHAQTPAETLQTLAQDKEAEVRFWAASHPQTEVEVLQTLTQDTNGLVQSMANLVQRLPEKVGGPLLEQGWWKKVCSLLWGRASGSLTWQLDQIAALDIAPHIQEAILTAIAADWNAENIRSTSEVSQYDKEHLTSLLSTRRKNYRRLMVPFMSPDMLQRLAISPSWELRCLAALHARTLQETRQHLSQDDNRYVRAIARMVIEMMEAVQSS